MYRSLLKPLLDRLLALFRHAGIVAAPNCDGIDHPHPGWRTFHDSSKAGGKDGALFTMLKFRSMSVATPHIPSAQAAAVHITPFGRIIRRTSIDELPQIFNILRGDMSIVGPRPPLPAQTELCELRTQSGAIRCAPGLTGLAQINAYDGMPEREVAVWDQRYAQKITLLRDIGIVLEPFHISASIRPRY